MKKIILLLGLSLASLGALSFDELIYKDEENLVLIALKSNMMAKVMMSL